MCDCWLPGIENPDPEGPLDRGGFAERPDATAFKLGIDRERAELDCYHAKPQRSEVEHHRRVA